MPIVGGIECTAEKKILLVKIENRKSKNSYESGIILYSTRFIIFTDLLKGYRNLNNEGFQYKTVNYLNFLKIQLHVSIIIL